MEGEGGPSIAAGPMQPLSPLSTSLQLAHVLCPSPKMMLLLPLLSLSLHETCAGLPLPESTQEGRALSGFTFGATTSFQDGDLRVYDVWFALRVKHHRPWPLLEIGVLTTVSPLIGFR